MGIRRSGFRVALRHSSVVTAKLAKLQLAAWLSRLTQVRGPVLIVATSLSRDLTAKIQPIG